MGSSPLMSIGVKAMSASYAALQVTGQNIANANVAGYSRQDVLLATAQGQFTGAGFFGKGVDVKSVIRTHDEFLTRESASAKSLASMDSARFAQLQRLERVFATGEAGLGNATSEFLNAMVDLSSRPADGATRQVVLARAGDLATRFADAGSALDQIQLGVTSELRTAVAEVNALATSIAQANQRVASMKALGQPPNDLLDERDRLIAQLAGKVQLTRIEADDGSMSIFIGGGQRLVLGSSAAELEVMQDPSDPMRSAVGIVEGAATRLLDGAALGGGAVAGLLRFQNDDLATGRNLVGRMATAIGTVVNEQQQRGITLEPPLGSVVGAALFGFGAPAALPHAGNARNASGVPIGAVNLTIVDSTSLEASEYDLAEDPANAGQWLLTRRSDGLVRSVANGDTVDGVRIDFGVPPPQAGDRYLLQPVTRAANRFERLLGDGRDLAAASPLLQTATGNTGTASVASLVVNQQPLPYPGASARITFTDNLGNYSWDVVDTVNTVLASGTGSWSGGADTIPAPPAGINGFTMKLAGVPRSGDVLSVVPTPASAVASNNGNALALLALRDAVLAGGRTPTEAYAEALANIGVRVQGAESASVISESVAGEAELARSSRSGVNLDEEAARLIQYQQSYQAAAKMLQVAQSLFDTLLDATR